jgi:uridine kinase
MINTNKKACKRSPQPESNLYSKLDNQETIANNNTKFLIPKFNNEVIVIGIAGGSGSGKTTLARQIYEEVGAENIAYIEHDSYYKDISFIPKEERKLQNFDHPNSLDTPLLVEHILKMKAGEDISVPLYDYTTNSRMKDSKTMIPKPIILLEGILILSDKDLCNLLDVKIYVDTDDDLRFIRRLKRDISDRGRTAESVINQYLATVRPMHLEFVEPSKKYADIIVPVGANSVALDLVASKLKSVIFQYGHLK